MPPGQGPMFNQRPGFVPRQPRPIHGHPGMPSGPPPNSMGPGQFIRPNQELHPPAMQHGQQRMQMPGQPMNPMPNQQFGRMPPRPQGGPPMQPQMMGMQRPNVPSQGQMGPQPPPGGPMHPGFQPRLGQPPVQGMENSHSVFAKPLTYLAVKYIYREP